MLATTGLISLVLLFVAGPYLILEKRWPRVWPPLPVWAHANVSLAAVVVVVLAKTAVVVPQKNGYVIERLGKFSRTLRAGFHILIPFIERIAYKHTMKEQAIDIAEQVCITNDNVQVGVDGVLYMQVCGSGCNGHLPERLPERWRHRPHIGTPAMPAMRG